MHLQANVYLFIAVVMAPIPFPSPMRIGCDICRISRVGQIIKGSPDKKDKIDAFLRRILTNREQIFFRARFRSELQKPDVNVQFECQNSGALVWTPLVQHLAGRWAAKEACIKAVKPRRVSLGEVEVWPNSKRGGEPYAIIIDPKPTSPSSHPVEYMDPRPRDRSPNGGLRNEKDKAPPEVPSHDDIDGQIARVSISHDDEYAMAVAMVVSQRLAGDDVGGEAAARETDG